MREDASTAGQRPVGLPGPAGLVLAGGASRRMGTDKGRLRLPAGRGVPGGGLTLAAWAAVRLAGVCPLVLVADRRREARTTGPGDGVADPFGAVRSEAIQSVAVRSVAVQSISDGPGRGPAAGILGGALAAPGRPLLVLACDVPRVSPELLAELLRRGVDGGHDLVAPFRHGRPEPLVAFWSPRALDALAVRVAAGAHALHPLFEASGLAVERLEGEALESFGDPDELLANLNTPEDWRGLNDPGEGDDGHGGGPAAS